MPSAEFELVSRDETKDFQRNGTQREGSPRATESPRGTSRTVSFDKIDVDDDIDDEDFEDNALTTDLEQDLNEILQKEDLYPWFNVVLIAIAVGCVEYIPLFFLGVSINAKYAYLDDLLSSSGLAVMTLANVAFSITCIVVAVLTTQLVPCTAGSGIPPLIGYLYNGRKADKELFTSQMVLVKMVGVELAIVGGLAVGREGPAIHIGSAIGDLTNRFINKSIRVYTGKKVPFSGQVKSNVVMMGATCGFASAFRSPIGGMLYCVEEIATHWDIKSHMSVGAQTFVAAAVAAFTTQVILNVSSDSGKISFSSIIIFSEKEANEGTTTAAYQYHDLPGFLVTAICCGLLAGITTQASNYMKRWRKNQIPSSSTMKIVGLVRDAIIVAGLTTLFFSLVPLLHTHCRDEPSASYDDELHRLLSGAGGDRTYVQYTCPDGKYSPLASLSLAGEEGVIRHLLSRDGEEFQLPSLVIFLIIYIPISVSNRILAIPMGSFVPNLLIGALVGRIVGEAAQSIYPSSVSLSPPGVFALLGAAAMLGAWTRTMMAVVVTLLEITGDIGLVSPLICGVVIARSIANTIADHSFTHEQFYELIDDPDSDGPLILHPNDWKPQKKVVSEEETHDGSFRKNADNNNENSGGKRVSVTLATPLGTSRMRGNSVWSGMQRRVLLRRNSSGDEPIMDSSTRNAFLYKSYSTMSLDRGKTEYNDDDDISNNPDIGNFNTNFDTEMEESKIKDRPSALKSARRKSWTAGSDGTVDVFETTEHL
jgi:H+/Cl- antiporter ClcA